MVAVPFTAPALCGAKLTVTVRLEPAVTVTGKVRGLMERPAPDSVTAETTRSAFPVLVTVTVRLLVVPTVTLPKFRLLGAALIEGLGVGLGDGSETPVPPHPVSRKGNTNKDTNRSNCPVARFRTFTGFLSQMLTRASADAGKIVAHLPC